MCAKAMSRAKAASDKMTACGHICQGGCFYRAKPATEQEQSGCEVRRTAEKA